VESTQPETEEETEDLRLWRAAQSGGDDAVQRVLQVVRDSSREVLARQSVVQDGEALVQDVVASTLASLKDPKKAVRYLPSFARYRTLGILGDHRRRERTAPVKTTSEPLDGAAMDDRRPDDALSLAERAAAIRDCCTRLSRSLAAVIELRYFAGASPAQIGSELGITADTVYVRQTRALKQLKPCLVGKGVDL